MFILDTNILSAIMGARPVPEVAVWIAGQLPDSLFTTSICQAEILSGLAIMPEGARRGALATAARAMFLEDFAGRVLPFDAEAAIAYGEVFAERRDARYRRLRGMRRSPHQSVGGLVMPWSYVAEKL